MNKIKIFYGKKHYKFIKNIFILNLINYTFYFSSLLFYKKLPFYGKGTIYSAIYYDICYLISYILVISFFIVIIITIIKYYLHLKNKRR